jgi:hypothetical protein
MFTVSQQGNDHFLPTSSIANRLCVNPEKPTVTLSSGTLLSSSSVGNQWYKNGLLINGATGQFIENLSDGLYKVAVSIDGCVSEFSNEFLVTETTQNQKIDIYPNPASEFALLKAINPAGSQINIRIIDALSRPVEVPVKSLSPELFEFDLKELTSGVYFIQIYSDYQKTTIKRLIVR